MTIASSRPAHRLPVAAWPTAAGLLVLLWAVRQGIEAAASRSSLLWMLGASLVLFAAALVLDRRAYSAAAGVTRAGPSGPPSAGPGKATAAEAAAAVPTRAPPARPAPALRESVKTVAAESPGGQTALAPVPSAAAPAAPVPATGAILLPAVSRPSTAAAPLVMSMTLGDLLLGALIDDPEDAGRLLSAAVGRATRSRPPGKPEVS